MIQQQNTIAQNITIKGVGLHTGVETTVKLLPSEKGRHFIRVDLPDRPLIPATVKKVSQTTLSTELEQDGGTVRTVEHLLAALVGLGVDNVAIEIDGPEVPLLDGSAQPWVNAILEAGLHHQDFFNQKGKIDILSPITVRENDAFITAYPASELRFTYGIDFEYEAIGNQWYSWTPQRDNFAEEIAPARTFGLEDQIEKLQQAGLIKGGSLANALVCGHQGWLNPPLRFTNEPVRHKLLDLLGDLSLLGTIPQAHYVAYKASHKLHIQLANQLNSHKKL